MGHSLSKNTSLIYTLGMVQFPRVPNIERYVDKFMDLVRHEYPLDERETSNVFNAEIISENIQINRQEHTVWQFTSIDRVWSLVLTDKSFCLHTAIPCEFISFAERFQRGIEALSNLPEINIEWFTAIGIRYVYMLSENDTRHFPVFFPETLSKVDLKVKDGVYITRYTTEIGELRIQALRNPPFTLPPDLNSSFIIKNRWMKEKPSTEFALIDLDHIRNWPSPQKFDVDKALDVLNHLSQTSLNTIKSFLPLELLK